VTSCFHNTFLSKLEVKALRKKTSIYKKTYLGKHRHSKKIKSKCTFIMDKENLPIYTLRN